MRSKIAAAALALGLVFGSTVAVAPPAQAWSFGYVYISLPTWLGNCNWGNNGRVDIISGTVSNVSSVSMDRGDDIVYMRVRLGDNNQVQFTAHCNRWPGSWQPGFTQTIRPSRNNQTVWVGPAGVRYN